MPELPEAETICRQISPQARGKTITAVMLREKSILRHPEDAGKFRRGLKGRRICRIYRRGKAVIFTLDNETSLVVRLGMSGTLKIRPADAPADKHVHLVLGLGEGKELRFRDPRKFGGVTLRKGVEVEAFPEFAHYGPEPFSETFNAVYLANVLKGRKAKLGVLLMDQRIVAGIGKIYSDEICFHGGIRPGRAAGRLTKKEIERLVIATREVLEKAIEDRGTTAGDRAYIDAYGLPGGFQPQVYQKIGQPCVRCGKPVKRTRMNGNRGLHWCAGCQK